MVGPGLVVLSENGKRAAVARPGFLTVVDVTTNKQLLAIKPPDNVFLAGTPATSLSADGTVLTYAARGANRKNTVVVWSLEKDELLAQVEPVQATPVIPLLAPDGKTFVTHGPPPPLPPIGGVTPANRTWDEKVMSLPKRTSRWEAAAVADIPK